MRRLWIVPVIGCLAARLFAQDATHTLATAERFYKARNYDSAGVTIREFLLTHGKDPAAEYLIPLLMEACVRKGDCATVNKLFPLYHRKYAASPYMGRVWYLHGYSQAKTHSYHEALESYSSALSRGVSGDLDSVIMKSATAICAKGFDRAALHAVAIDARLHPRICAVAHNYEAAANVVRDTLHSGDGNKTLSPIPDVAQPDTAQVAGHSTGNIKIGLLAPLSGEDADVGKRVSQGVALAIDRYNASHLRHIELLPRDTRGALLETVRRTKALLDSDHVQSIVGPMLSPTATATAGMVLGKNIVMLTPTATDDGIAALGPNIFQMNITLGVLARRLAGYAAENLNIRDFVVLAPRTAYGSAMAAAFREEVTKRGGVIFEEVSFEEGGNDYTSLLVNLRRALLIRRLDQVAKERLGDRYRPVTRLTWTDSAKWSDSSVSTGAIFIPADAEDAASLAAQIAFNRIKAQLLGSTGWRSSKTVIDGNNYVQNAIISAPFEPDSSWRPWPAFRNDYATRFHEEPDRVAALGYDAGNLIGAAIDSAGRTINALNLSHFLLNIKKFEGAAGFVSFDPLDRTNTEAVILKLTPNGFIRVQ